MILVGRFWRTFAPDKQRIMSETIFLIHGMWGGPWYWENYQRVFEQQGHRCIAATLPFHDMAPDDVPDPRLGTSSLLDYAAALEQEIGRIGLKPVVVGHSMGGLLAQILGSRGLAKALVLLAPSSPAGIMGLRDRKSTRLNSSH